MFVSFHYYRSFSNEALIQGEILYNVLEIVPVVSQPSQLNDPSKAPDIIRRLHPYSIIITQDCDLYWDWQQRNNPNSIKIDENDERKELIHIELCDLFLREEIRFNRGFNRPLWERVESCQDERYHKFEESHITGSNENLPVLYADFKRIFSLPTDYVYSSIVNNYTIRKAVIPYDYLWDFTHRLYSYLSRASIPEDE